MGRFFRSRPLTITLILVIVLLALLVSTADRTDASGAYTVAGGIFVPVQRFFYQATDNIVAAFEGNGDADDLAEENARLREELAALQTELNDYDEIKKENERLSLLLQYQQENPQYTFITAEVVSKNPGNWFDVFTIGVGKNDGVETGMPVVTADGVVGTVTEVGADAAKVMAMIDGSSGVSAIVERTRDYGSVRGRTGNDPLQSLLDMNFLPMNTDIQIGDRVLTSGLDGVYPKGLVIGEVTEVGEESNEKKVVLKPAVDFGRLEEVMVLAGVTE